MNFPRRSILVVACLLCVGATVALADSTPVELLVLPGSGGDSERINYDALPRLQGTHVVVHPAALNPGEESVEQYDLHHLRFNLHNYLVHHDGRFWCLWSDGPPIEDEPTQEVRFATSLDGLSWSESKSVTGTPLAPQAFIARDFWIRDGPLLALVAHFHGKGAFGAEKTKQLQLQAYAWDSAHGQWQFKGKLFDNAINNFAPQRLPSGDWLMTRRDTRFNVSMMIGGRQSLHDWEVFPVVGRLDVPGFSPDEPILWLQPDQTVVGLFRNNGLTKRLFYATSRDRGRTWSKPTVTNYPDAGSKLFSLQTSRGYRVLVSNAHPQIGRRELYLAISEDGLTFTRLAMLAIPASPLVERLSRLQHKFGTVASLQYPHVIEHDGYLLIAFSRNKKQIELLRVSLNDIERLRQD